MIVGDKERFGIEFELDAAKLIDPKLAEWMFGRIRWWCGGEEVGRYDADTTIRDVSIEAKRFLTNKGMRRDNGLMNLSSKEVVSTIVAALYEDHGQSDEQVRADDERYRRFVIKPLISVFDPWDIFLIEGDKNARLMWRRVNENEVHECQLAPGEFDAVLNRFLDALRGAGKSE
jgi:hypothetical protein